MSPLVDITPRRDGFVLALLVALLVLLVSGLAGAPRVFGYALVLLFGMLMGLGFIRRRRPATWLPPCIATTVLLLSFAGMFANQRVPVRDVADTVLGFQPGTAFLVYGVWLPAFFTIGVAFALVFRYLQDDCGEE